ncbi:MAG: DUF4956 domain-containing protein [Muribaculaceae bacterium]|nr:DUF4956 domain-containing protein [Muribaculaceae bacterium]
MNDMDEINAIAPSVFSDNMVIMAETFAVNILFSWIIIHFLYYRKSHRRDFYFTFLLISIAIFFLMFFMTYMLDNMKGKTSIGIGIGLFGIFSIMRYRTDTMPVREMTYLFSIICLAVVNALAAGGLEFQPIVLLPNMAVLLAIMLCELLLLNKKEATKLIQYDRIALITPDKHDELIADLEERTGLKIKHAEVGAIDFLRDMAIVRITYVDNSKTLKDARIQHTIKLRRDQWENVQDTQ